MNSADHARLMLAVICVLFCALGGHFLVLYLRLYVQAGKTAAGGMSELQPLAARQRRVLVRAMAIAALMTVASAVAVAMDFD